MYCIKCGVQLDNSVKQCPLCQTRLQYPEPVESTPTPLYPKNKHPQVLTRPGAIKATLLVMFLIPLLVTFLVDLQTSGGVTWFGYAAGGIVLGFIVFVFPFWFQKPNPVFLTSCDLAAAALYLFYIDLITPGSWFFRFALPVVGGIALMVICVMVLQRRLPDKKLWIYGGLLVFLGLFTWMVEWLLDITFQVPFFGWSYCSLGSFVIIGGLLIYLAANDHAREKMERKLFM